MASGGENISSTLSPGLREIPRVETVDNIAEFMEKPENRNYTSVIKDMEMMFAGFKDELDLKLELLSGTEKKIREHQSNLEVLDRLIAYRNANKIMQVSFNMTDQMVVNANISPSGRVKLSLGADVLLEYTLTEAGETLNRRLSELEKKAAMLNEDINVLQNNVTTIQCNLDRIKKWKQTERK